MIKIICFEEKYAPEFKQLNLAWLEYYALFEPEDLIYLDSPQQVIIEQGGSIFLALEDGKVVGTCALIKESKETAELAKLAVSPGARKRGVGRSLTIESIQKAKRMGFKKIVLVSNKKLTTALGLYESLGFKHAPIPTDTIYATADVYMVLEPL